MKKETQAAKQAIIDRIVADMKEATSVAVVEYRGLSVNEAEELRRALRGDDATMKVYKNTYVDRALDELGYGELRKDLIGPNALIFSRGDSLAGPRNAVKFAKKHPNLIVKSGVFEGKVIDREELTSIALLPGREGLISMLLSCLESPIRSFAVAVKALGEKKAEEQPAA